MSVHLLREIDRLKRQFLSLCALVEDGVELAVRAFLERNADMAYEVQTRDTEIDRCEIEVEEECLKVLALHQPVAGDLRLIVAAMKINNDLERIGDLAVNISRKALAFVEEPLENMPFDIAGMWRMTQSMLHESLDALVNLDAAMALSVCERDDQVDRAKYAIRVSVEAAIQRHPERVRPLLRVLAVARNLERIADCAANIAEDVIYLVEGRIVRHGATA